MFIFYVKHFESALSLYEKCYINKVALPCLHFESFILIDHNIPKDLQANCIHPNDLFFQAMVSSILSQSSPLKRLWTDKTSKRCLALAWWMVMKNIWPSYVSLHVFCFRLVDCANHYFTLLITLLRLDFDWLYWQEILVPGEFYFVWQECTKNGFAVF